MAQSIAANLWNRMAQPFSVSPSRQSKYDRTAPSVGDRYAQTTDGAPVWVVENILRVAASSHPLVKLTSEKHPDMLKIVSLSTLADHDEFTRAH